MTDGEGTTTYGYDAVGRLTSSSRASRTTTYTWDDAGRPLSVTYPASGGTVDYGYDAAGRLDEISDWADRLTTFTYDEASRVTDIARPGDLTTEITYDALDRPLGVEHSIDATPTLTQGYTYDANGNLASYSDDAGTATFSYDDLDRLTDAVFPSSQTYEYAYDAVGNLTAITKPGAGTTTLAYDLADRITTSGYSYDDNGALTADPSRTYAYDAFGRLTSATVGATTTAYALDGAGRRLAETTSAVTTSFDLDLRGELATILSDGTRKYLPADPGAGHEQAGTWYSTLADQVGSPHSLVSSAGVQGSITRWDPYGAARPGSSATVGIGYGGEWRDPAGLIDLRARAYDPALGRFVSRDGFAGVLPLPQTANRYSYALNGPYRYGDPSGRFAAAICANGPLLLSIAVQSLPVVGDAYSALTGFIGYDPIAGVILSDGERAAAIASAFVIGGGFHLLGRLGGAVPDAARLGRDADNLADMGVGARGVDGVRGAEGVGGTGVGISGARLGRQANSTGLGSPSAYSVAFETQLSPNVLGKSRSVHFNRANEALDDALRSDPAFADAMEQLIPGVGAAVSRSGGRSTPDGWIWHHVHSSQAGGQVGVMRLVPVTQHAPGSAFWSLLHPGGVGGYSEWAIPRGAPPN